MGQPKMVCPPMPVRPLLCPCSDTRPPSARLAHTEAAAAWEQQLATDEQYYASEGLLEGGTLFDDVAAFAPRGPALEGDLLSGFHHGLERDTSLPGSGADFSESLPGMPGAGESVTATGKALEAGQHALQALTAALEAIDAHEFLQPPNPAQLQSTDSPAAPAKPRPRATDPAKGPLSGKGRACAPSELAGLPPAPDAAPDSGAETPAEETTHLDDDFHASMVAGSEGGGAEPTLAEAFAADLRAMRPVEADGDESEPGAGAAGQRSKEGIALGELPPEARRTPGMGHDAPGASCAVTPSREELEAHAAALHSLAAGVLGSEEAAADFVRSALHPASATTQSAASDK